MSYFDFWKLLRTDGEQQMSIKPPEDWETLGFRAFSIWGLINLKWACTASSSGFVSPAQRAGGSYNQKSHCSFVLHPLHSFLDWEILLLFMPQSPSRWATVTCCTQGYSWRISGSFCCYKMQQHRQLCVLQELKTLYLYFISCVSRPNLKRYIVCSWVIWGTACPVTSIISSVLGIQVYYGPSAWVLLGRPRRKAFSVLTTVLWIISPEVSLASIILAFWKAPKTWFCQQAWGSHDRAFWMPVC